MSIIAEFVSSMHRMQNSYKAALEQLSLADKKTVDYLHYLKFGLFYEYSTENLVENLRVRRASKDLIYVTEPLGTLVKKNSQNLGTPGQALGEMKKREKLLANRIYTPRAVENEEIARRNNTAEYGKGE